MDLTQKDQCSLELLGQSLLQAQFGPPPVSPFGVVPDLVAGFHANPLRDGPVLLLLLGEEAFDLECLVRRHGAERRGVPAMAASEEAERAERRRRGGRSAPCRSGGPTRTEGRRPSEFVRVYLGLVQKTAMAKIR